ncbi:hypothetical protein RHSIM_Rhsim03G0131900 [Rhododendron simsii]|uniref:Uncharacterized protein n=1 Tax=Rhododendron simsii TaxID=118357 RepID=A0A834H7R7_RHOSS|nr:hypothetical protein RHSIM_Rhsim03G0131900 [Rhododendron simsii]
MAEDEGDHQNLDVEERVGFFVFVRTDGRPDVEERVGGFAFVRADGRPDVEECVGVSAFVRAGGRLCCPPLLKLWSALLGSCLDLSELNPWKSMSSLSDAALIAAAQHVGFLAEGGVVDVL